MDQSMINKEWKGSQEETTGFVLRGSKFWQLSMNGFILFWMNGVGGCGQPMGRLGSARGEYGLWLRPWE
jgi:hypothetical protein